MFDGIWYTIFDEQKVNEARYMNFFRAYRDVFLDFVYKSHPLTLENNFTNSIWSNIKQDKWGTTKNVIWGTWRNEPSGGGMEEVSIDQGETQPIFWFTKVSIVVDEWL